MSKKRNAQKLLLEHSKAKVELLGKYLDRYLNIIANDRYTKKIKVYDLFCGEGEYDNGGKGSPLIILKAINDLHILNKAQNEVIPPIDVRFNDLDSQKIAKLKSLITNRKLHHPKFGNISFSNDDYKNIVQQIVAALSIQKKEKSFIFIDPYGYKSISAKEIKDLLKYKNSEVLLFLPTQFMYRFDKNGTPQALLDFIQELDYENWLPTNSVWKFIEQLKKQFSDFLGREYFVDTFSIEKDPQTVYCLFFFSSHIRGFEKMLETKWLLDMEKGKGWSYEKTFDLFASQEKNILEEKLLDYILTGKRSNGDLYDFTLRNSFLPKHATEICKHLQKQNKLFVYTDNKVKLRKGAFYINYKDYKNNYNRIYFKTK